MTSDETKAILELGRSNPVFDDERVEDRRANTEAMLGGPPAAGTDAVDAPLAGRPARWFRPDGRSITDGPVVLYLHGGVYEVGSPLAYQPFCSALALLLDAVVLAVDYRLAPEHPFPAALDDALAAYRALLDQGHPSSATAVVGDSAGGGLALACLIAARRAGLPQPAAAVAISPWTDLTNDVASRRRCEDTDPFIKPAMLRRAAEQYLAGADPKDPLASPAHAAADDLAGLAPVLLQAAANEVLADDATVVAERLALAGGDVTLELCPEAFHVYPMAGPGVPEAAEALGNLARFLHDRWSASAPPR
jgi:monoterpene epsilon-lactone hydrolase